VNSANYTDDIDDQGAYGTGTGQLDTSNLQTFLATANYAYDELGNLIRDRQEEIAAIEWTVYGKIKAVTRTGTSTKPDLAFGYDAGGNRLWKKVTPKGAGAVIKTFYYIRDAKGNEMARYVTYTNTSSELLFISEEHSLYGSARIGVDGRKDTLYKAGAYTPAWCGTQSARRELGRKQYELTNHLGNVLVSLSDKKAYKTLSGSICFEAEIITLTDYYPFGSAMQTRTFSAVRYRFGFNGKEKDGEVFEGSLAFEARIFDCRLGRFLSLDPRMSEYVWQTPFAYFKNSPTSILDIDGMGGPYHDNHNSVEDNLVIVENSMSSCSSSDPCSLLKPETYSRSSFMDLNGLNEPPSKHVVSHRTYRREFTKHSFEYEPGDKGKVVGNDIIRTYIFEAQQVQYSDGTSGNNTVNVHYWAMINREGSASKVNMSYEFLSSTSGSFRLTALLEVNQAPRDFQELFNAAYNFKNNPPTRQKSFIQEIADRNKLTNSGVDGITKGVGAISGVLQYIPGVGPQAGKILAGAATLTRLAVHATNSEDPTKITIDLIQPNTIY
jgi:RHS repeat-associated protein